MLIIMLNYQQATSLLTAMFTSFIINNISHINHSFLAFHLSAFIQELFQSIVSEIVLEKSLFATLHYQNLRHFSVLLCDQLAIQRVLFQLVFRSLCNICDLALTPTWEKESIQKGFTDSIIIFQQTPLGRSAFQCQEYIIVNKGHMNYLTMVPNASMSSQKAMAFTQPGLYTPTNAILQFLSLALKAAFSQFASQINKKIIQEEFRNQRQPPVADPVRPRAHTQPQIKEKTVKPLTPKPVQKFQPNKAASAPKAQKPKMTCLPSAPPPTIPAPNKKDKKPLPEPVPSPKLKKKIHKIVEVKKENPGRVPRVSMIETAEVGSCRLGEKERRKLKERLLMRQVREWRNTEESKRDRRDLRPVQ